MASPHTETTDAEIARLALLNYSASQIAAALGAPFTRNSVIGRAHRTGIQLSKLVVSNEPRKQRTAKTQRARRRGETPEPHPRDIVTIAKTATPARRAELRPPVLLHERVIHYVGRVIDNYHAYKRAPKPAPEPVAPPDPTSHAVDIFGLTSKTCRNPLGPKMEVAKLYCGKPPQPGSAYCSTCHALNYAPRLPPTRATIDKRVSKFGGYLMAAE